MKKKFRFLSAILTPAMCVGLCVPASASVYDSDEDNYRGVFTGQRFMLIMNRLAEAAPGRDPIPTWKTFP